MCVLIKKDDEVLKPGTRIPVYRMEEEDPFLALWTGSARAELLSWWQKKKGHELVTVEATAFAERADDTREIIWKDIPRGAHFFGILLPGESGYRRVQMVTTDATPEEEDYFRHDRSMLLGPKGAPFANWDCVDNGKPKREPKYKPLAKVPKAKDARPEDNQPSLF